MRFRKIGAYATVFFSLAVTGCESASESDPVLVFLNRDKVVLKQARPIIDRYVTRCHDRTYVVQEKGSIYEFIGAELEVAKRESLREVSIEPLSEAEELNGKTAQATIFEFLGRTYRVFGNLSENHEWKDAGVYGFSLSFSLTERNGKWELTKPANVVAQLPLGKIGEAISCEMVSKMLAGKSDS